MTKTNKDGFVPGQDLTHADLMKMRAKALAPKPVKRSPKPVKEDTAD